MALHQPIPWCSASVLHAARTQYRRLHSAPLPHPHQAERRFLVEVTRPDGSTVRTVAIGGCSFDHTIDGIERGGLGSVVRVKPAHEFTAFDERDELLTQLLEAVRAIRPQLPDGWSLDGAGMQPAVQALDAAIAKATGPSTS